MLDKEQIEHIAKLARLDLSDDEKKKYAVEMGDILSYIDQLNEVDTKNVEPTAQVTGLENSWREDEIKDWDELERKNALNQAPDMEDNQIKVRKIL